MNLRNTLLRVAALGLTGGAAILGLALDPTTVPRSDAAPPSAQPPALRPDFPVFPGYYEASIGQDLEVNGQRMDLHQYYADEPAAEIADFYEAEFSARSDKTLSYNVGNASYVTMPTEDGRFMQVMVIGLSEERTLVIPSLSSGPILPGQEAARLPIPLPDRTEGLTSYRSDDGGRTAIGVQFSTPDGMEKVGTFFRDRLTALGWAQQRGAVISDRENGVMRFRDPAGRQVSIGVQGLGDTGAFVFVLYEEPQP